MADTAYVNYFTKEIIDGYEQQQTLLRRTVMNEAIYNGQVATFLVSDSGGRKATTRGNDGDIPKTTGNDTQPSVMMQEWHDLTERTGFNIFTHQSRDLLAGKMIKDAIGVMNRKTDEVIIAALDSTTVVVDSGAGQPLSKLQIQKALTKLGNAQVPLNDGEIFGALTPAAMQYLMEQPQFSSSLYVDRKPYTAGDTTWKDDQRTYYWNGVNWLVHSNLPNAGLSNEKCFIWHRDAVGFAADAAGMKVALEYESKQDRTWARTTLYMAALKLQNAGIVEITHDGSALA